MTLIDILIPFGKALLLLLAVTVGLPILGELLTRLVRWLVRRGK